MSLARISHKLCWFCFLFFSSRWYTIFNCSFAADVHFDHWIKVASAWLLHFKVTLFLFIVNWYLVRRKSETMRILCSSSDFQLTCLLKFINMSFKFYSVSYISLLALLLCCSYCLDFAIGSLFKLASACFPCICITLWASFVSGTRDVPSSSCTFPGSVLDSVDFPRSAGFF